MVAAVGAAVAAGLVAPAPPAESVAMAADSEWACGEWGMYGRSLTRTFSVPPSCPTPFSPLTVAALVPAWVFDTPKAVTASPAVVDGTVYVGSWEPAMYALDARTGVVRWRHEPQPAPGAAFGPVVSSAAVAGVAGRRLVIFGAGPRVYALDAETGAEAWVLEVGAGIENDPAEVESSPVVWEGTVYVGMDVHNAPGDETGGVRGGLLAIDAATGQQRWKYEPEAAAGQPPSGCGGVWGSPVIDAPAAAVVFGTANCPAVDENPALPMEELTALDATTGAVRWTFRPHDPPDLDHDYGATPNLFRDLGGRLVLGAGNKDGRYYALDPATGAPRWATRVTEPVDGIGGFIGSPAVSEGKVFGATAIGSLPAFHSLDGRTGAIRWQSRLTIPSYGASAVVNGVVFNGALDGILRAFDARNGRVLWAAPLSGPISSGPAIAGDLLVVGAGTTSSDACVKDIPLAATACEVVFNEAVGQLGGVHAFRMVAL